MAINAGKLRHRVRIEQLTVTQDQNTGLISEDWSELATVWAHIAPLSAREFIAAQSVQSKISARITMRYRDDIGPDMRLVHLKNDNEIIYNPHGMLEDDDSGLEYVTIPCSRDTSITGQ